MDNAELEKEHIEQLGTPQTFVLRSKEIVAIQFIPTNEGTDAVLKWLEEVGRPFQSWTRSIEVFRSRGDDTLGTDRLSVHFKDETAGNCHLSVTGGDWIYLDKVGGVVRMPHHILHADYEKVVKPHD